MSSVTAIPLAETPSSSSRADRRVAAYVYAAVAAAAMVGTLPGRTHGLGLVTEPLLHDLQLDRVAYAALNLWATLVGAAFCLPFGRLLDRIGLRTVLTATLLGLGAVVVLMSRVPPEGTTVPLLAADLFAEGTLEWVRVPLGLFVLVLLTRGLGQSALSVESLALVGKAAGRRPGPVIGAYSFLVAVGFMAAFAAIKAALEGWDTDWRTLWAGIGWVLIVAGVAAGLFVRNPCSPDDAGTVAVGGAGGYTLGQAVRSPVFWVFGLATTLYGMIAAGVSLFNQSLLAERGFDRSVFLTITTVTPLIGLAANLGTGWLANRCPLNLLLGAAMAVLAVALLVFPFVTTLPHVYAYAAAMGVAGGMVTVLFFAVWGQAFGTRHLGHIQGAAQLLTVLGSAFGPLLLAASHRATGSYTPLFRQLAVVALVFAVAAWLVPMPRPFPPKETCHDRHDDLAHDRRAPGGAEGGV
jgi:MFS family permease